MDSSIIAAISAILGTTVGGLSTFATTLLNQRYAMRRDLLAKDVANREQLYSEFLKEVGNLYFDSVNRTLQDTSQQASLIRMYSLVGRIRMISSEAVLTSDRESCRGHRRVLQAPSNDLSGIPTILGGLQSVERVYESMSSRAGKHAGTLIVLPVANRAFAHCRSNHEDRLPRHSGTSPLSNYA